MKNDYKLIKSNMLWNSVGSLFYMGCQWLLTVLVVRLTDNYQDAGILSLAMSISTALWGISTLNLRTFQISELEGRFSDGDFLLNRILAVCTSFGICFLIVFLGGYSPYTMLCIITFMFFRLSEAIVDVIHGIDQKSWRLDIAGKSFLARGCIMLLAFWAGEKVFHSFPMSIILMAVGVYAVILFYDVPTCKRCTEINLVVKKQNIISLIKIGIPLGTYSVLLNTIAVIPRLVLERCYGESTLGIFASISTPTVLIPQIAMFIFNPLTPIFAVRRKNNDYTGFQVLLGKCCLSILLVGVCATIAGYFWGPWALVFLFGKSIKDYTYLLVPIIITAIFTAMIWLLCAVLTVLKEFNWLTVVNIISILVCLAFSFRFIPDMGILGAVLSLGIALFLEIVLLLARLFSVIRKASSAGMQGMEEQRDG